MEEAQNAIPEIFVDVCLNKTDVTCENDVCDEGAAVENSLQRESAHVGVPPKGEKNEEESCVIKCRLEDHSYGVEISLKKTFLEFEKEVAVVNWLEDCLKEVNCCFEKSYPDFVHMEKS